MKKDTKKVTDLKMYGIVMGTQMALIGSLVATFLLIVPAISGAEERMCTMQYEPVCGARIVQCIKAPCYPVYETFGNRCVLNSADAIYIHSGECTEKETGAYDPTPITNVPKIKTTNEVTIAIDGVPLTSVNLDLSDTDTDRLATTVESPGEPTLVSLWKGLWSRVSDWLRM